jgi:DNA-binding HxlR family transcriptional regulator
MSIMSTKRTTTQHVCTTTELKLLGDFWTLAIIQALRGGGKRFSELQRELHDASPTTLTNRLKKLEQHHLVKRKTETVDRLSVVYALSAKGEGILPVLREIKVFADKFL